MTRITKPMRGNTPTKKLDLTDMRALFHDHRVWTSIGIVQCPEGVETHWEVVTDDAGTAVDVLIEVLLAPSEVPTTCRLRAGMWEVPALGDEVIVIIPEGAVDFMPIVVGRLSTNVVPTVQGPQPGRLVIVNGEVLVHDGAGGAVSLALKSDVEAVDAKYADHLHLSPNGATEGPLATTLPNPPNPAFPSTSPFPFLELVGSAPTMNPDSAGAGLTAATITGTSVLLGK